MNEFATDTIIQYMYGWYVYEYVTKIKKKWEQNNNKPPAGLHDQDCWERGKEMEFYTNFSSFFFGEERNLLFF